MISFTSGQTTGQMVIFTRSAEALDFAAAIPPREAGDWRMTVWGADGAFTRTVEQHRAAAGRQQ